MVAFVLGQEKKTSRRRERRAPAPRWPAAIRNLRFRSSSARWALHFRLLAGRKLSRDCRHAGSLNCLPALPCPVLADKGVLVTAKNGWNDYLVVGSTKRCCSDAVVFSLVSSVLFTRTFVGGNYLIAINFPVCLRRERQRKPEKL